MVYEALAAPWPDAPEPLPEVLPLIAPELSADDPEDADRDEAEDAEDPVEDGARLERLAEPLDLAPDVRGLAPEWLADRVDVEDATVLEGGFVLCAVGRVPAAARRACQYAASS